MICSVRGEYQSADQGEAECEWVQTEFKRSNEWTAVVITFTSERHAWITNLLSETRNRFNEPRVLLLGLYHSVALPLNMTSLDRYHTSESLHDLQRSSRTRIVKIYTTITLMYILCNRLSAHALDNLS
jgi:hypothetical protein